jgi:hypothetical protein
MRRHNRDAAPLRDRIVASAVDDRLFEHDDRGVGGEP